MTTRREFLIFTLALPAVAATPVLAQSAKARFFNTDGVAIHGYDPVGYFVEEKPVDGSDEYILKWMGVTWRFASAANMTMFESDPNIYAPQYGGYCAFAMSQGYIATSVPEAWTVYEGKLYLNFSKGVRRTWKKDIPGYVQAANGFWPGILSS